MTEIPIWLKKYVIASKKSSTLAPTTFLHRSIGLTGSYYVLQGLSALQFPSSLERDDDFRQVLFGRPQRLTNVKPFDRQAPTYASAR